MDLGSNCQWILRPEVKVGGDSVAAASPEPTCQSQHRNMLPVVLHQGAHTPARRSRHSLQTKKPRVQLLGHRKQGG